MIWNAEERRRGRAASRAGAVASKFLRWMLPVLAFSMAAFLARYATEWVKANDPGLSDSMRGPFVETAISTCVKKQSAEPGNKGLAPSIISDYCKCYANGLATRLSNAQLKRIYGMSQADALAAIGPDIEAASSPCLDDVAQKVGKK